MTSFPKIAVKYTFLSKEEFLKVFSKILLLELHSVLYTEVTGMKYDGWYKKKRKKKTEFKNLIKRWENTKIFKGTKNLLNFLNVHQDTLNAYTLENLACWQSDQESQTSQLGSKKIFYLFAKTYFKSSHNEHVWKSYAKQQSTKNLLKRNKICCIM